MTDKLNILVCSTALGLSLMAGPASAQTYEEGAGDATDAIAEEAQEEATDGVESASEVNMIDPEGALTLARFDYDSVVAAVDDSQLPETRKATLLAGLDAARDDPEALAEVLERIREAIAAEG